MAYFTYNESIRKTTDRLLFDFTEHLLNSLQKKGVTAKDLQDGLYSFVSKKKSQRTFIPKETIYLVTDYSPNTQLLIGLKTKTLIKEFKAINSRPSNIRGFRVELTKNSRYGLAWTINDLSVVPDIQDITNKWDIPLVKVTCSEYEKIVAQERSEHFKNRDFTKHSKFAAESDDEEDEAEEPTNQ
jgi:hypothetical protein